jgi:hypothetical protein
MQKIVLKHLVGVCWSTDGFIVDRQRINWTAGESVRDSCEEGRWGGWVAEAEATAGAAIIKIFGFDRRSGLPQKYKFMPPRT